MSGQARDLAGVRAYVCDPDAPPLASAREAADLVGEAWGADLSLVAIPVGRLPPDFLRLASGVAGEVAQKFVNYRIRLAVVGDISQALADSSALRAFVAESNRGAALWFVADLDALEAKLAAQGSA